VELVSLEGGEIASGRPEMSPPGTSELISVLEDKTISSRFSTVTSLKLDEDKDKLGAYLSTRQL